MTTQQRDLSQCSILLIDDDARNLDALSQLLALHGMTVVTAQDGVEALMSLEKFLPTLVITDLSMPNMSGWEILRHIKAEPLTQHIPVIALTGHTMSIDKDQTTLIFDSYITKPFKVSKLMDILDIYFAA